MTFAEKTRTALLAAPPVAALVNARIFPALLPQGVTFPAIRTAVISDAPTNTIAGSTAKLRRARMQVDCFAKRYGDAQALADAVAAALQAIVQSGFTSMLLNRRDQYEDDTEVHAVSLDFSMWMSEG